MAERTQLDVLVAESDATCPQCRSPRNGERCHHCGIAFAPNGHRVIQVIAERPHGRVYLTQGPDGRRLVVKELLFATVPDIEVLDGFDREGEILRQLDHPSIPRFVASFGEGSGVNTRLYLVQEHVEGESLLGLLQRRRFTQREALDLARRILETLVYLHGLSPLVVHRDIKPANLIVRADGSIALVDFGAARDLLNGQTHGATLVGTLGYMPPEQLGGSLDPSSDVYALGATLIHLLARQPPWELLRHDMTLDFEGRVNAAPAVIEFLKRLVERDRAKRFKSATEALVALGGLAEAKLSVSEDAKDIPRVYYPKPRVAGEGLLSSPILFPALGAGLFALTPAVGVLGLMGFPLAWIGYAASKPNAHPFERVGGGFLVAVLSMVAGLLPLAFVDALLKAFR